MSSRQGWVRGTTVVVTVTAITASSLWMWRSVSKHGWQGTMRYIWVGDPLSPEVRKSTSTLEKVKKKIPKLKKLLAGVEEALSKAKLDSIDDEKWNVVPQWIVSYAPNILEKDLIQVDSSLDKLAAEIDGVPSHQDMKVKLQKKEISQRIVQLMERADHLLALYAQREK